MSIETIKSKLREIEFVVRMDEASQNVSIDGIRSCAPNSKWDVGPLARGPNGRVIIASYAADVCITIDGNGAVHTLTIVKNRYGTSLDSVDFFVHDGRYVDLTEALHLLKAQAS